MSDFGKEHRQAFAVNTQVTLELLRVLHRRPEFVLRIEFVPKGHLRALECGLERVYRFFIGRTIDSSTSEVWGEVCLLKTNDVRPAAQWLLPAVQVEGSKLLHHWNCRLSGKEVLYRELGFFARHSSHKALNGHVQSDRTLQRTSNILLEEFHLFRLHSDSRALNRTGSIRRIRSFCGPQQEIVMLGNSATA